jgi:hypothetical protein
MVGETSTSQDEPWFSALVCFRWCPGRNFLFPHLGRDNGKELELLLSCWANSPGKAPARTACCPTTANSRPKPTFFLF